MKQIMDETENDAVAILYWQTSMFGDWHCSKRSGGSSCGVRGDGAFVHSCIGSLVEQRGLIEIAGKGFA
jgi:hypothetical protein